VDETPDYIMPNYTVHPFNAQFYSVNLVRFKSRINNSGAALAMTPQFLGNRLL